MNYLNASIVLLGEDFQAENFSSALQTIFVGEAGTTRLKTPIASVVEFEQGYSIQVSVDRINAKRDRPGPGVDERLAGVVRALLNAWPQAKVRAAGINFAVGSAYDDAFPREQLTATLLPPKLEAMFGSTLLGTVTSVVFNNAGAKATLKITTDAIIEEKAGYLLDLNAHYQPIDDIEDVLATQEYWLDRLHEWAGELTNASS